MAHETKTASLEGRRSASELIRAHDQMAIPHFQRGLVWDTGSVALLLESLYYGTPCGSVLLWTPSTPIEEEGVALGGISPSYLIVDGQQRLRSLNGVFRTEDGELPSLDHEPNGVEKAARPDGTPDDMADSSRERVWCINLNRIPALRHRFPTTRRFELFRYVRDPRAEVPGVAKKDRAALVPLRWLLEHDDASLEANPEPAYAQAVEALLGDDEGRARLRRLLEVQVFDARILGPNYSTADVVGIYNRINSAGKRVEAEERAFANLVLHEPEVNGSLKRFFAGSARREPSKKGAAGARLERDGLIRREQENRFGFKLFMRVSVMALAYHTNMSIGSAGFSFASADRDRLEAAAVHLPAILGDTEAALSAAASCLRDGLHCDDFRMMPRARMLWPLFQLLVRFPLVSTHAPDATASAALHLMLSNLKTGELLKLCSGLGDAGDLGSAVRCLTEETKLRPTAINHAVRDGVEEARSLTSRYTLLLYWLIRSNGARDFSYRENECQRQRLLDMHGTSSEPSIRESARPEKQHLVPHSRLNELFRAKGGRARRGELDDIGNLTYISHGLNHWQIGVGSNPLNLKGEPGRNLAAHLIDPAWLDLYDEANHGDPKSAKDAYAEFCRLRRERIVARFVAWARSLRKSTEKAELSGVHPRHPLSTFVSIPPAAV